MQVGSRINLSFVLEEIKTTGLSKQQKKRGHKYTQQGTHTHTHIQAHYLFSRLSRTLAFASVVTDSRLALALSPARSSSKSRSTQSTDTVRGWPSGCQRSHAVVPVFGRYCFIAMRRDTALVASTSFENTHLAALIRSNPALIHTRPSILQHLISSFSQNLARSAADMCLQGSCKDGKLPEVREDWRG